MKVLFVDHSFHSKTGSSAFFAALLGRRYTVETLYFNPDDKDSIRDLDSVRQYDLVVIWQLDFLAPLVLARGVRTIVVPMYDGSSQMPDLHWLWARKAQFVNFSMRLHVGIQRLGCRSLLVKYFLPPIELRKRACFDGLRVLLWQRRPEDGLNLHFIEKLVGTRAASIHIHDAPDQAGLDSTPYLKPKNSGLPITVTRWFEHRSEFDRLMESSNVLIAPRRAEGIGMAMLEGLSRGMLVIAHRDATHDEYIADGINGLLVDVTKPVQALDFTNAVRLGEMAWRTAEDGHLRWQEQELAILDLVEKLPPVQPVSDLDVTQLDREIVGAYFGGGESYRSYLLAKLPLIERMSGQSFRGKLDASGWFDPNAVPAATDLPWVRAALPWIAQNRIEAAKLAASGMVVQGRVLERDGVAWIAGHSLSIGFRIDPQTGATNRLKLAFEMPPGQAEGPSLCVALNDTTLAIGPAGSSGGFLECILPPHALRHDNYLHIFVDRASFAYGLEQPVSLGLRRIELVP